MQDSSNHPADLRMLGLDPSQAFYDLNLAGSQGVPVPSDVAGHAQSGGSNAPDFTMSDMQTPDLQAFDLVEPGITYMSEFAPDPALPDLNAYNHPYNVTIVNQQGMVPDSLFAPDVPSEEEIAASLYPGLGFSGLDVRHAVTDPDPPLPDLQHPELTQQVHMPPDARPGDLDPSALDVLHATGSYQQVADSSYPASQMDQRGMNTTRARHLGLLDYGLDGI